jgi:leader peptidase (prepilin peptidase)/N-methyltransferase
VGSVAWGDAPLIVLLAGIAGAIFGSFLATLVLRWPADRNLRGRSVCDDCGRELRAWELIPLVSYFVARGRRRACGGRIEPLHPAIELACAALTAVAFALLPWDRAAWVSAASLLLLTLAILDARHFWLPDLLTFTLGVLGILASVTFEPSINERLVGAALAWSSLALIAWGYRKLRNRTGLGAGDPKLFAAIGAWAGWTLLPVVLLGASLAGLAVAAILLIAGRKVSATTRLPFGTLLAAAALPAIYWTALP